MLRNFLAPALTFAAAACAAPAAPQAPDPDVRAPQIEPIAEHLWVHKSWSMIEPWGLVLSQGLVIETATGPALIDSAWNDKDTRALLELIETAVGAAPHYAVLTHAHEDKMGGVGALRAAGVETRAHVFSNADAPARGLAPADTSLFETDDLIYFGGVDPHGGADAKPERIAVFYPGAGHTRDNIVVYVPSAKILFGGCLIRPANSTNLGNTADADVSNWANAVRRVAETFPEAKIVVPSHGAAGGRELLDHTIALAEAANAAGE